MADFILGKKIGMTQIFRDDGTVVPVTVVQAGPCPIVQVKTKARDRYCAVQLGFDPVKPKRVTQPLAGHFARANVRPMRLLREFRIESTEGYREGDVITVESFSPGDLVDVVGTSKGRGFAGVMKRHNFSGAPAGHGTHEYFRHGGSIGCATTPGHVLKGKRMAGHLGNARVTVKKLTVEKVLPEKNLLLIKGAVPGWNGGYLPIRKSGYHRKSQGGGA